jgi:hypothetical protein
MQNTKRSTSYDKNVVGFRDSKGTFHEIASMGAEVSFYGTRPIAAVTALTSPIWIPLRALGSLGFSIGNILSLGKLSVIRGLTANDRSSRLKSVACSALSIVLTPASMLVEGAAAIGRIFKPGKINKADLIATHLWTGFVGANLRKPPTDIKEVPLTVENEHR